MAYKLEYRPTFRKDIDILTNKAAKSKKDTLYAEVGKVVADPEGGKHMKGNLLGMMHHAFGKKPQYRILYALHPCQCQTEPMETCALPQFDTMPTDGCQGIVSFLFLRTREECNRLYKTDRKIIKNILRI